MKFNWFKKEFDPTPPIPMAMTESIEEVARFYEERASAPLLRYYCAANDRYVECHTIQYYSGNPVTFVRYLPDGTNLIVAAVSGDVFLVEEEEKGPDETV